MNPLLGVTMLIQQYHPVIGGAERQLAEQARLLRGMDVAVQVITRRTTRSKSFERIDGTAVYRVPTTPSRTFTSLRYTTHALYLIRRLKPNLVHAHGLLSTARTALLAQRLLKLPVVVTTHNLDLDVHRLERTFMGERHLSALRQNVNAFVSVNKQMDEALARLGVPPERRAVIPNGVDAGRFSPATREEKYQLRQKLGAPEGPVVLFVGRLVPEKRVDHLLHGWSLVSEGHPTAELWIVGDGPLAAPLRELAGANVRFVGQQQDVVPYLRMADLLALTSATEGLSVAFLEALATELPVIATQVGGITDVVANGHNALLVPPNDLQALARALTTLLDDAGKRTQLGRAGRETIMRKFQLRGTTQQMRDLYQRILDGRITERRRDRNHK